MMTHVPCSMMETETKNMYRPNTATNRITLSHVYIKVCLSGESNKLLTLDISYHSATKGKKEKKKRTAQQAQREIRDINIHPFTHLSIYCILHTRKASREISCSCSSSFYLPSSYQRPSPRVRWFEFGGDRHCLYIQCEDGKILCCGCIREDIHPE